MQPLWSHTGRSYASDGFKHSAGVPPCRNMPLGASSTMDNNRGRNIQITDKMLLALGLDSANLVSGSRLIGD